MAAVDHIANLLHHTINREVNIDFELLEKNFTHKVIILGYDSGNRGGNSGGGWQDRSGGGGGYGYVFQLILLY